MSWTNRTDRIRSLTAKQEAQIPAFGDKWKKIATSTEPFENDVDSGIEGIKQFFKAMGCRQPKKGFFTWNAIICAWKEAGFEVDTTDLKFFGLEISPWGLRCRLTHVFEPRIVALVENFMNRNIPESASIADLVEISQRGPGPRRITYGQGDAPWLALADFFATVCGEEYCQKLTGLMQAVASCGFLFIKPDEVFFCDRPAVAKFDDRGRLHCEDAPAIQYRSGLGLYALNGVPIPKKYIETPAEQIKFEDVLKEENTEVRMAVLRKFGFARLLSSIPHRVISSANGNALIQFKIAGRWPQFYRVLHLKWQDKTGPKETILPVPRTPREFGTDRPDDLNDCEQVRRWTLGWPKDALAVAET